MIIRAVIFITACFLSSFVSCTRHPAVGLGTNVTVDLPDRFFCVEGGPFQRIHGFGQISGSVDGRRYSGSMDLDWRAGFFKASAYSPFGALVASMQADSFQGEFLLAGRESRRFFLDSVVDSIPFITGEGLTFRDFICILSGRIPERYNKFSRTAPDTVQDGRRGYSLIWREGAVEITLLIHYKKNSSISSLVIRNVENQGWQLALSGIDQNIAQSVELKADDRNYFSIRYERLKNR